MTVDSLMYEFQNVSLSMELTPHKHKICLGKKNVWWNSFVFLPLFKTEILYT